MGLSVRDEFIDQVAAAGFAAVRLPVRWSAHASVAPPYAADPGEATVPAAAVDVRFVMV